LRRYDTGVSSVEVFDLSAGLERLGGVVQNPAARRGLFAGEVVLAFSTTGAESYALGALDAPPLSRISLPEIYEYP
jgi:hypothetical protein